MDAQELVQFLEQHITAEVWVRIETESGFYDAPANTVTVPLTETSKVTYEDKVILGGRKH